MARRKLNLCPHPIFGAPGVWRFTQTCLVFNTWQVSGNRIFEGWLKYPLHEGEGGRRPGEEGNLRWEERAALILNP
jgi:hypothetical protein